MIGFLSGTIKYLGPNYLILLTKDGVGYKIHLKANSEKLKSNVEYFIYQHLREDRSELYGFKTPQELNFFETLITVSGVGPKMATNILANLSVEKISQAIVTNDVAIFTSISGVGKKLAGKIILELKPNLAKGEAMDFSALEGQSDLVDALESLGYKKREILPYLSKIPAKLKSTEEKVKWILKNLKK